MENGPRGASARATSSKRSAPRSNQADQLASRGTRHRDQSTRSNGPEAKLKREEVKFDGQWEQGEFDGDVQMDGAWVPYYGKTDSAVACSSERPDQFESSYPTRTAVSQATVGAVYRKPVGLGGGSTARREKRTTKLYEPHQRSDDDDVTITSATLVPTRNDPWDQSKTHDLTSGGDAAIAWALQEEEEKKKVKMSRKKPSKRPTSSSSPPPSASTQDDLVARDYEIALRLQESLDKEMAASLQTEGADFMSYAGAEGMHNPRLHYATRHSLGPLKRQQLHHRPTLHLDNFGHLNHVYLPRVYNRRMEYPEDSMSYETLLELEDIPVGMSRHNIASHSTTFTFNSASAGTSSAQETCSICLEPFVNGQKLRALPCLHSFHCPCVERWLSQSKQCPICFKNIQEMH